MKDGFLKVAAVTPDIRVADVVYNTEKICGLIDEAVDRGAKIVVFPELCCSVPALRYPHRGNKNVQHFC